MRSISGVRTRWAAIGAACAVAMGVGSLGVVNAVVNSGSKGTYVPVTPTRVLDTRDTTEISGSTLRLVIEGVLNLPDGSTRQVVPSDASAVSINITVTNGRKNAGYGYVTAFDCVSDSDPVPNSSAINFEDRVDIANALNLATSNNGSICFYVYGTADLIVDVNGYYVDHNHDDRYYTEQESEVMGVAVLGKAADQIVARQTLQSKRTVTSQEAGGLNYASIAMGKYGRPLISLVDEWNQRIKVVLCDDPICATSQTRSVATYCPSSCGRSYTDLILSGEQSVMVTYYDPWNGDLKAVNCSSSCSSYSAITLDSGGDVGSFNTVTVGINGNPVVGYYDVTNGDLKIVVCADVSCQNSNVERLDTLGDVGQFASIAITVTGNPIISYYDVTNTNLKVAYCTTPTCSSATTTTLDSAGDVGQHTSIAIANSGNPIISYYDVTNTNLKVAYCATPTCSSATTTTLSSAGNVGFNTSVTVLDNGNPVISYQSSSEPRLNVAVCQDLVCSGANSSAIDSQGINPSMLIGIDGVPLVAYSNSPLGAVAIARPWWVVGGR